jgi:hypothetical protein
LDNTPLTQPLWKPSYNNPDGSWIVRIDPIDPSNESDQIICTVGRWNCRRGKEWCQRWDGDNLFAEPEVKTRGEGFYTRLSTKDPDASEKVDKIYFEFQSPIYPNPICPNILWRMDPQPTNARCPLRAFLTQEPIKPEYPSARTRLCRTKKPCPTGAR